MKIAVLDIGGTSIKSGIFQDGVIHEIREYDTNAKAGGQVVMEKAISILKSFHQIERIGISTAGQVDAKQGLIRYANENIPGYTGMKIKEILEAEFGVPVAVENDVNAAAIGEANYGAGKGFQDFLCLTYGTGVGGAIVLNGDIYRGSFFSAGEMGAIIMHPEDRNKKDKYAGCYEKYASTTALIKKAMKIDETLVNGREVFLHKNDARINEVIDQWITEIVMGLTSLIHVFNPEAVLLGGGIMKEKVLVEEIAKRTQDDIMESFQNVQIKATQLGNSAGLYGATVSATKLD